MADNVGAWVIRPEDRYLIKYDYRGGESQFKILRDSFTAHEGAELIDRVLQSPLAHVYKAMENFHFSSIILHQLLVRSVHSDRPDELRFRFGNRICRFGRREFALITGLHFGPVEPDVHPDEDRKRSSLTSYVDDDTSAVDPTALNRPFDVQAKHITISLLEQALMDSKDVEVVYKIGLIYFIEAVLHGKSSASHLSPFVFHLVDDTPRFLAYNRGSYFWDITLNNLKEKRDGLRSHIGMKGKVTKDVSCLVYALFVWAYETVPLVGELIARHVNKKTVPRMLRWHPFGGRIMNEWLRKHIDLNSLVVPYLKASEDEILMLRAIGLTYEEIDTPPLVYAIPNDAPSHDNGHGNAHVDATTDPKVVPSRCETSVGSHYADTQVLGKKSDLSLMKEVIKSVNELKEHAIENIVEVTNDVVNTRNVLRADFQDTRQEFQNKFAKIQSVLFDSWKSRKSDKPIAEPQTSSCPTEIHQNEVEDQQHVVSEIKKQNPTTKAPTSKKVVSTKADTLRGNLPTRPPPTTFGFEQGEMSLNTLKRGGCAIKKESSISKKKAILGDISKAKDDSQMRVSDVFDTDTCMENTSTIDVIPNVGTYKSILNVSDSPASPIQKRCIQALLPEFPRTRRATQRPDRFKDFVYTSSVERKKVRRYDPFRPIDISKWRELRDWYNNPDAPMKIIDGVYSNFTDQELADPVWFESIYMSKKWLQSTHVDAYLNLLRFRMKKHPFSFKKNVLIFSHELGYYIREMDSMVNLSPNNMELMLLEGVKALSKENTVYTPWYFENHWVALVISIPSWDITVYDCMCGMGGEESTDEELRVWAKNMSKLLKLNIAFKDDDRLLQPFEVKRLEREACPQMIGVGDCGVFTVKYIEHLILLNASIDDVTQENMETFRDKMLVDIFHKIMDL